LATSCPSPPPRPRPARRLPTGLLTSCLLQHQPWRPWRLWNACHPELRQRPLSHRRRCFRSFPLSPGQRYALTSLLCLSHAGRYNVISWDPRSVNLTSPGLECFANEGEASRFQRDVEHAGLSYGASRSRRLRLHEHSADAVRSADALGSSALASSSNTSLAAGLSWTRKIDAFSRALDSACDTRANQAVLRSSSTAFTARDMKVRLPLPVVGWPRRTLMSLDPLAAHHGGARRGDAQLLGLQLRHHPRRDLLGNVP